MANINVFTLSPGQEPPPRPSTVRRLTFEDVALGWPPNHARQMVPLQHVQPGDPQVVVYEVRGEWSASLDGLPEHVESVYSTAVLTAGRPLPRLRELFAPTDSESLANLPEVRALSQARVPLDPSAIPPTVVDLICHVSALGSVEAVAGLGQLERLALSGAYDLSLKPLAALERLRFLSVDPGKDLRALGALERLEQVHLSLETASLSNLKAFSRWRGLRRLRIDGRRLKALDGVEAFEALEYLRLDGTGVRSLAPLAGHPTLKELHLDRPQLVEDWDALELPALRELRIDGEPVVSAPDAIFEDLALRLGVDTNHEAEDLIRGAVDPDVAARLDFDSESGAFAVYGQPADVARVRAVIDSLASRR